MNKIQELVSKGLITPPSWLPANVMYLTIMGSTAYGVSTDVSDFDLQGVCIPPKDVVFPHLAGEIEGFGNQTKRFWQWQQHHIFDQDALGGKGREYDLAVFSIVKYFQLCMDCNPDKIDSLFTPARCVMTETQVGQMIRENRHLFLCKKVWPKFKGYAYSQMHKMRTKNPEGKRKALVEEYGYDVKYAYHLVRLMCECEQILTEHTLDLERNREQLKSIRRGEWGLELLEEWFASKEQGLEEAYNKSTLPNTPREDEIKELLLSCLEHHYGSLRDAVIVPGSERTALMKIQQIVEGAL